ncbi:unnamed protein product [Citrullus colocynthis]|uniref:Uncharacterized protein n=1 Tax=Citrullus colocynthis TaxID=252529 RepID=A0ABP0Y581_9ROSI
MGLYYDATTCWEARYMGRFATIGRWFVARGKMLAVRGSFAEFICRCSSDRGSCTAWKPLVAACLIHYKNKGISKRAVLQHRDIALNPDVVLMSVGR